MKKVLCYVSISIICTLAAHELATLLDLKGSQLFLYGVTFLFGCVIGAAINEI